MNNTLDAAIKEAYALAPSSVAHVHTIELRHASIVQSLYLVQGYQNRQLTLETSEVVIFKACPFQFTLPQVSESGLQELNLTIDNVGGRASDFCELAMNFPTPVEIYYRPYLSTNLLEPKMNPPMRLFLTNVSISDAQVSGVASQTDFLNLQFPSVDYTRNLFPALGNL